jgi:hypothetical protein
MEVLFIVEEMLIAEAVSADTVLPFGMSVIVPKRVGCRYSR